MKQIGSTNNDYGVGVAIDNKNSKIYMTGFSIGAFPGQTALGLEDTFLI